MPLIVPPLPAFPVPPLSGRGSGPVLLDEPPQADDKTVARLSVPSTAKRRSRGPRGLSTISKKISGANPLNGR
jgi:hypothetical protein